MSIVGPLRDRRFRHAFIGLSVGRIGDAMSVVALVWTALQHVSPGVLGGILFAAALPLVATAPLAGVLVRRLGPRAAVRLDCGLRSLLGVAMAATLAAGTPSVVFLASYAVLNASLGTISDVALEVAVPELLPDSALHDGNALVSIAWDLSDLVGPAVAGLVIAGAGAPWAFLADSLTFVLMGLSMPRVAVPGTDERGRLGAEAVAGFRLLATRYRPAAALTSVSLLVLACSGAQEVLVPVLFRERLHGSAAAYGAFLSACGAATLVGTALLAPLVRGVPSRPVLIGALLARALGVAATGVANGVMTAGGAAVVAAASDGPLHPTLRTAHQRLVPARHRAQVAGARGALGSLGHPLGNALAGVVASYGVDRAYLVLAALHVAPVMVLLLVPSIDAADAQSTRR